jgi:hypothetical protein
VLMVATSDPPLHNRRAKLKLNEVLEIFDNPKRETQKALATRFRVSEALVSLVQTRKRYGWWLAWQRPVSSNGVTNE